MAKPADDTANWKKRLYDCIVPSVLLHRQLTFLEVQQAWFNDYDPVLLEAGLKKAGYHRLTDFAKEHPDDITVDMRTDMGYTGGVLKQGPRPPKLISDNMRLIRASPGLKKPNPFDQQKGIRHPLVLARLRREREAEEDKARRKTSGLTRSVSVSAAPAPRPFGTSANSSGFRAGFSNGYQGGPRGNALPSRVPVSAASDPKPSLVRNGGFSVNVSVPLRSIYSGTVTVRDGGFGSKRVVSLGSADPETPLDRGDRKCGNSSPVPPRFTDPKPPLARGDRNLPASSPPPRSADSGPALVQSVESNTSHSPALRRNTFFGRNVPPKVSDPAPVNGWHAPERSVLTVSQEPSRVSRFGQPAAGRKDFFDHFKEEIKSHRPSSAGDNNGWAPFPAAKRSPVSYYTPNLPEWGDTPGKEPPVIGMPQSEFLVQDELLRCKRALDNKRAVVGPTQTRPLPVELANNEDDDYDERGYYTESDESDGPRLPVSLSAKGGASRVDAPQKDILKESDSRQNTTEEPSPVVAVRKSFGSIRLSSLKPREPASSPAVAKVDTPVTVEIKEERIGHSAEGPEYSNGLDTGRAGVVTTKEEELKDEKHSFGRLYVARMKMYTDRLRK